MVLCKLKARLVKRILFALRFQAIGLAVAFVVPQFAEVLATRYDGVDMGLDVMAAAWDEGHFIDPKFPAGSDSVSISRHQTVLASSILLFNSFAFGADLN